MALTEGNLLELVKGITLNDCQQQCDNTNGCNNVGYCGGDCYLRDGQITENDPQTDQWANCFTTYKACHDGNSCILYVINIISV